MSKLFGYGESLEGKTEEILNDCEGIMDLAVMQAKAMDKMLGDFYELKEMNKDLSEQNKKLQKMLQELSRKIEK